MNARSDILNAAKELVKGEKTYQDSFRHIADLWTDYLGVPITEADVAILMCLLKIARTIENKSCQDNYISAASYLAIAGELSKDK